MARDRLHSVGVFGHNGRPAWAEGVAAKDGGSLTELAALAFKSVWLQYQGMDGDAAAIDPTMLSTKGYTKAKQAAKAARLAELDRVYGHAAAAFKRKVAARRAAAESTLTSDLDPSARAILFSVIWPRLPEDSHSMRIAYRKAVDAGDAVVCEAIEALPSIFDGRLESADIDTLRAERIASVNPDVAGELAALNQAERDIDIVADYIREECAPPPPDPVTEVLEGRAKIAEDGSVAAIEPTPEPEPAEAV